MTEEAKTQLYAAISRVWISAVVLSGTFSAWAALVADDGNYILAVLWGALSLLLFALKYWVRWIWFGKGINIPVMSAPVRKVAEYAAVGLAFYIAFAVFSAFKRKGEHGPWENYQSVNQQAQKPAFNPNLPFTTIEDLPPPPRKPGGKAATKKAKFSWDNYDTEDPVTGKVTPAKNKQR